MIFFLSAFTIKSILSFKIGLTQDLSITTSFVASKLLSEIKVALIRFYSLDSNMRSYPPLWKNKFKAYTLLWHLFLLFFVFATDELENSQATDENANEWKLFSHTDWEKSLSGKNSDVLILTHLRVLKFVCLDTFFFFIDEMLSKFAMWTWLNIIEQTSPH